MASLSSLLEKGERIPVLSFPQQQRLLACLASWTVGRSHVLLFGSVEVAANSLTKMSAFSWSVVAGLVGRELAVTLGHCMDSLGFRWENLPSMACIGFLEGSVPDAEVHGSTTVTTLARRRLHTTSQPPWGNDQSTFPYTPMCVSENSHPCPALARTRPRTASHSPKNSPAVMCLSWMMLVTSWRGAKAHRSCSAWLQFSCHLQSIIGESEHIKKGPDVQHRLEHIVG